MAGQASARLLGRQPLELRALDVPVAPASATAAMTASTRIPPTVQVWLGPGAQLLGEVAEGDQVPWLPVGMAVTMPYRTWASGWGTSPRSRAVGATTSTRRVWRAISTTGWSSRVPR